MFNIFDENIKCLLQDFLKQLQEGPVRVKKFRVQHKGRKAYINFLESQQILKAVSSEPHVRTYEITHIALYLADSELSKSIFGSIDKIAKLLRERYENNENDEVYISVKSIKDSLGISQETFLNAYKYLNDFTHLVGTSDINEEDARILLGESLGEFNKFSEIPESMLRSRFPNDFDIVDPNKKNHGNTQVHAAKREKILGAAIAVMAKYPDKCRSATSKRVVGNKVAEVIDQKSGLFFKEGDPPYSRDTISREINKWIKFLDKS